MNILKHAEIPFREAKIGASQNYATFFGNELQKDQAKPKGE